MGVDPTMDTSPAQPPGFGKGMDRKAFKGERFST